MNGKRWDHIWEYLLDTTKPHGRYFMSQLMGRQYSDWDVTMYALPETLGVSPVPYEVTDLTSFANNARITVLAFEEQKRLEMTCVVGEDRELGIKMFQTMVERARERLSSTIFNESFTLPAGFVIEAGAKPSDPRELRITLYAPNSYWTIPYHRLFVRQRVPHLQEIMEGVEPKQVVNDIIMLAGGAKLNAGDYIELVETLAYLSTPKIFSAFGASKEDIAPVLKALEQAKVLKGTS